MRALVPGVHLIEKLVALVNGQHRAFDARRELRASHDHDNFDQSLFVGVKPGHFAVKPDKILVGFFEKGFSVEHAAILADRLNWRV